MGISRGRSLEYVGSLPQLLKLFDRDDEAPARDHINDGEDAREQPRVRKLNDGTLQPVCRGERLRQIVSGRQKDIGDLKTDGVSLVYQWALLTGGS